MEGYNGRLDAIQAGILRVKLQHLSEWNESRRQAAARYRELFTAANGPQFPAYEPDWSKPVYHLYVIRVRDRESLLRRLADENIGTGIHYPVPLHLQKAYSSFAYKPGDFPVTEKAASEIVSLPMFPNISADQQIRVVKAILSFVLERGEEKVASVSVSTA
jgi:dTDP-4-amino-4,6-dideoxygalactose transaminase